MENSSAFIEQFVRIGPMQAVRQQAVRAWGEDIPLTLLFSSFGEGIAEYYGALTQEQKTQLLDLVESGMKSGNQPLRNAVATGLLEALHQRASQSPQWDEIKSLLGETSMDYLNEWIGGPIEEPAADTPVQATASPIRLEAVLQVYGSWTLLFKSGARQYLEPGALVDLMGHRLEQVGVARLGKYLKSQNPEIASMQIEIVSLESNLTPKYAGYVKPRPA